MYVLLITSIYQRFLTLAGVLVTFFDQSVVIQAFFLTAAVVIGLTAFTFQARAVNVPSRI